MDHLYHVSPMAEAIKQYGNRLKAVEDKAEALQTVLNAATTRILQLEKLVQYPNGQLATSTQQQHIDMHEQAARAQATEHLYAPLRSDTRAVIDLAAFARRLIDMQDLGHAVTEEVRQLAMRALGKEK